MRVRLDLRFADERREYRLACSCESCAYFDPGGPRCAHGYPNAPHECAAFDGASVTPAMFCKDFELV